MQTTNQGKAQYNGEISWEVSSTTTLVKRHSRSDNLWDGVFAHYGLLGAAHGRLLSTDRSGLPASQAAARATSLADQPTGLGRHDPDVWGGPAPRSSPRFLARLEKCPA